MPDVFDIFEGNSRPGAVSFAEDRESPFHALDQHFGNPEYLDERFPHDQRLNQLLHHHASHGAEWNAVHNDLERYFPHVNPVSVQQAYEPLKQQEITRQTLADARSMIDEHPNASVNHHLRAIRNAIPLVGTVASIYDDVSYSNARKRAQSGQGTPD